MKLPKETMAYCPTCKKHTLNKIALVKKHKASELAEGQRRYRRKTVGYTGFPRPKPSGEKAARRKDLRLECVVCKKERPRRRTFRAKKFELVKKEGK